ncbi:transcription-repair coupling factor [Burkholderia phage vB_BpP_HN05]
MMQFTGTNYIRIDVANNFGHDKWTWNERIQWVHDHDHELEQLLDQADVPALYYASVKALRAAQRGEVSNFPISLDATASGMQILSALTGDRNGAALCNVVNRIVDGEIKRADGYTIVFEEMKERVGSSAEIKRDMIKKAVNR